MGRNYVLNLSLKLLHTLTIGLNSSNMHRPPPHLFTHTHKHISELLHDYGLSELGDKCRKGGKFSSFSLEMVTLLKKVTRMKIKAESIGPCVVWSLPVSSASSIRYKAFSLGSGIRS